MDRRGFLRGIFGGVAAGGLIVAATPQEIEAFSSPLAREQPLSVHPVEPVKPVEVGGELYNAEGELVAYITQIEYGRLEIDVTSHHSEFNEFMVPGLRRARITAEAVGPIDFSQMFRR